MNKNEILEKICTILIKSDELEYLGEGISQLQHALQSAYFARKSGGDNETIVAALLHDIGRLAKMELGTTIEQLDNGLGHEYISARVLRELGFSPKVCALVRNHVSAKRYLVTKSQEYYESLSPRSKYSLSLAHQRGKMTELELLEFETDPYFHDSLKVRTSDDKGKVIGLEVPNINSYRQMIINAIT